MLVLIIQEHRGLEGTETQSVIVGPHLRPRESRGENGGDDVEFLLVFTLELGS